MEKYPPNSHRYKSEKQTETKEKNITKVVKGTVKTKKKSGMSKFSDVFISEDAANVKSYIFMDILIPAAKKAISDIVTNGIDMILYGETRHSSSRGASKVSYRSYYDRDRRDDDRRRSSVSRIRTGYNLDDIVLESRGEAEDVLTQMDELVDRYGLVCVADLYELVGLPTNHTDFKYGWTTNIRNADVVRTRDGYMLKLPKVAPID